MNENKIKEIKFKDSYHAFRSEKYFDGNSRRFTFREITVQPHDWVCECVRASFVIKPYKNNSFVSSGYSSFV